MRGRRGLAAAARPPLTIALLLASLALTALLARQGYGAARSHRLTVERVLRDYAALAAGELVRRATAEVGYYGYFAAISAFPEGLEQASGPGGSGSPDRAQEPGRSGALERRSGPEGSGFRSLPSPEELAAGAVEPVARGLELARTLFRLDPATGRLEQGGAPLAPELAAWLAAELPRGAAAAEMGGEPFSVAHAVIGGRAAAFVYTAEAGSASLVGFLVDRDRLADRLAEVVARAPLLPAPLGGSGEPAADGAGDAAGLTPDGTGGEGDPRRDEAAGEGRAATGGAGGEDAPAPEAVRVRVRDPAGRELFRSAGTPRDAYFEVEVPFGDEYQGAFRGYVVDAAIDPRAAPELVIGGLPRSRLPELAGLLALSAGLTAVAILQLRRERALARTRSDFVSRVSHELRTPLTQIRMFAETLLLGRVRSSDERRRALEIIDREARRLGGLVETVLQFSRAERGAVRLAPARVELAPLVAEQVRELRPLLAADGVDVRLAVEGSPSAMADEDALRQVLLNLLDNAVRHGGRDREVVVELGTVAPAGSVAAADAAGSSAGPAGARVFLAVDDAGPGIPAAERQRVWEPFYRGAAAARSSATGTGIGLAVVRDLVERQDGSARVEASRRGGARFVVELPAAPAADEEKREKRETPETRVDREGRP